jgi:hypothetical protein
MTTTLTITIIIHILAVICKLGIFVLVPRVDSVAAAEGLIARYKPYERTFDWVLWITGAALLLFARVLLSKPWMLVSIALYTLVFILIRVAVWGSLTKVAASKKRFAREEISKLKTNNWCVALVVVGLLAVIAYLMMAKP